MNSKKRMDQSLYIAGTNMRKGNKERRGEGRGEGRRGENRRGEEGCPWIFIIDVRCSFVSLYFRYPYSDGVGRTGVFSSLFIVLERMRSEGVVDLFQTVKLLRTQRPAMVQSQASENSLFYFDSSFILRKTAFHKGKSPYFSSTSPTCLVFMSSSRLPH